MQPSRHAKRSSKRHYGTSVNTVNLGLNYGIAGNSVSGTNQNAASQKLGPSDDFNMIARNQPQLHNRSYSTGLPKSRVLSPPRNDRPNSGDSFFDMKSDEQQKIGTLVGKTSWQTMNSYNTRIKANQSTSKTSFPSSQNVSQTYNHQKELSQEIQRVANSSSQMNQSSPHFYLPGDKVIFTEDSAAPGIPVIYRIEEERRTNPDKLNLDRRGLVVCPILEGEENLRLLNFQHNLIRKIENLGMLRKLIFLDLYDNQIEEISGLSWLRSLRVLMLGKNRLRKIDNLHDLSKLDVLDLHGNKIAKIENLSHLLELRVLNLAGNELIKINKLHGLESLTELNLRRNKITSVNEIDELPSLQRLFLSYNDIRNFQDISCLSKSTSLTELSLDGNPLTNESNYKQIILHNVTSIKQLDMKKISDEERRITSVMARKEDEKRREFEKISTLKERRQLAINNAKCQYEAQFEKGSNDISAKSTKSLAEIKTPRDRSTTPKLSSVGTDYSVCHLAELDDNRLNFYGSGSLEAVDRNWGEKAASSVIYVSFHFINFDQIVPYLAKIKSRFVNITNICFAETNLCHLSQINALAVLRNLSELTIDETGNPVTEFNLWKPYVLFRLAHLSLQTINGCEVTTSDSVHAEKMFGALGHVTTSQLSQSRLITMLAKQKKSGIIQDNSRLEATSAFLKRDKSTNSGEPVNRAGLMHHSLILSRLESEDSKQGKRFARNYMNEIVKSVAVTEDKQEQFERIWPEFFSNLLEKSVKEMSDIDQYMELSLENIKAR